MTKLTYRVFAKDPHSNGVYRLYEDGRVEHWLRDGRWMQLSTITGHELLVAVYHGLLHEEEPS